MRTPLVAGNWKMNTTVTEAVRLVIDLRSELDKISQIEKVVCPPFISLAPVAEMLRGSAVKLGAQNMFFEEKGAFTGEVSPLMLAGLCEYVILGHSERRHYFGESGDLISKKVASALQHRLKPILCVGEILTEYEAGQTKEVVGAQLASSLAGVSQIENITIAYEPVWAIGTGKAATGQQANETIALIRALTGQKYGATAAGNLRILYGGSVTAGNIREFIEQSDIDGGLVGGASLKAAEFVKIAQICAAKSGW